MARGLKFRIQKEEGFRYQCSETKGADQLRDYREADLRLCFRICKKPVFLQRDPYTVPLALKLPCGVYPERIGNASKVHRECIQSVAFLLECHSNWSFWNVVPYYVSAPMERSRDHSKDSEYRYRALHSG